MTSLIILLCIIWKSTHADTLIESIDRSIDYFIRSSGSFVVQRDGTLESVKPAKLKNADEFEFSGGYRTEQGIFAVQNDIITPIHVPVLGVVNGQTNVGRNSHFWPDATVPFVISQDVTPVAVDRLYKAMRYISDSSCIKFEAYNNAMHRKHQSVLTVQGGPICASFVGYHPSADPQSVFEQHLIISDLCPFGSVLHELMHTLGFRHENDRADSSLNIQGNTRVIGSSVDLSQSLFHEYDHFSIMHKTSDSISLDPLRQFMLGQRVGLSFMDKRAMNHAYRCGGQCPPHLKLCQHEGFVGRDCKCVCPDGFEGASCERIHGSPSDLSRLDYNVQPKTGFDSYGSNRKLIVPDAQTKPLLYEDMKKPILMLYDHHLSSVEYTSVNSPQLQAAVFLYNPSAKITVDLSNPSYLSQIYKYGQPTGEDHHGSANKDKLITDSLAVNLSRQQCDPQCPSTTVWFDIDSFKLDQYHPVYSVSPQIPSVNESSMLDCNFNEQLDATSSCPLNYSQIWIRLINETDNNGYMYIDNSMFNTENRNSALLRFGPIDAYTGVPSCLSFDYRLNGKGVGGLATYYIARGNDRRQGSVIGWADQGDQWARHVKNLSSIFYDKMAAKNIMLEFAVMPGWDAQSSISLDNVKVEECYKLQK